MTVCVGADGCKGGFVSARREGAGIVFAVHGSFAGLAASLPPDAVLALDMPIGLPDRIGPGGRGPEVLVRRLLKGRSSSVFSMVSRRAVEADAGHGETCRIARATSDPPRGISLQGYNILPKVREVDRALRADPGLAARVHETHPETALCVIAGAPVAESKKTAAGRAVRRALLSAHGIQLPDPVPRFAGAAADDVIDAAICLMVAERIASGAARSFPETPERDRFGLPVVIRA